SRRRLVLLADPHRGTADLDRGHFVTTDPPEHDLARAGLGIEVPPTLPRNERDRKGPILGADVQDRGPVRFADQTVHLLILLYEPVALALVRRFVAARRELLSGPEGLLERVLDQQHGSHDCGYPDLTSGTRTRARHIRSSRHHPFLHFRLWSGSESAVATAVASTESAAVESATEPSPAGAASEATAVEPAETGRATDGLAPGRASTIESAEGARATSG